jgi:glycosyltransferase involved in cell wall biosynthesis
MRVLVFSTDDFLPPAGGAETAFGEVAQRMGDWQFDLICARLDRSRPALEQVGNITIHRLGFGIPKIDGIWLWLRGFTQARILAQKKKFDLVWSIMASYGAIPALNIKKELQIPYLLTLQEGGDLETIAQKGKLMGRYHEVFEQADGVHAISNYLARWAQKMGYRGDKLRVIPNGVDLDVFATPSDAQSRRSSWNWDATATVLVTTSRLVLKNGVEDIIEALTLLPEQFKLVIAGDGVLLGHLKNRVEELHLTERVRFLGFVARDELPGILHASDIFVRPSLTEGLGSSFLEAMAAGIPVIGTSVGGITDFLVDALNGFFTEPKNPQHLAVVIQQVANLSSEARTLVTQKARETVSSYDWKNITQRMKSFISELCQS